MSQWYLSKNGQALGPLDQKKLEKLIADGEVKAIDLVYKAGAAEWLPVSEIAELASHLASKKENAPTKSSSSGSKDWVLLKKIVTDKGKEYKQLGPFDAPQVIELIDTGEIRFTDFAWKEGFESWVRIAEIDSFSEPLPSSPAIDMSLYEKTVVTNSGADTPEETQVDADQKKSLTHLVSIETFEHEKTQVRPQQPKKLDEEKEEEIFPDEESEHFNPFEQTEINGPINNDEFVTESGATSESSDSDVSLWSLEPPSQSGKNKKAKSLSDEEDDGERTRVTAPITEASRFKEKPKASKKRPKEKKKPKKKQKSKNKNQSPLIDRLATMDSETWQFAAAIGAVILSFFFFYLSLQTDKPEVIYDKNAQLLDPHVRPQREAASIQKKIQEIQRNNKAEKKAEPIKPSEIEAQMAAASKAIEKAKQPILDDPDDLTEDDIVISDPKLREKLAKTTPEKKSPPVPGEKRLPPIKKKTVVTQQTRVIASEKKSIKRKELKLRSQKMRNSKKRDAEIAKVTATPKPVKRKTSSTQRVSRPTGGAKAQSFYRHRDRKALFYSSLKAEALAVEIESRYKELKNNKSKWRQYYSQWRKRVRGSMARDIRSFPSGKEVYAYPDFIKAFKDDYEEFYKYGEVFNAKVTGGRLPSGSTKNMKQVFGRHKMKALRL